MGSHVGQDGDIRFGLKRGEGHGLKPDLVNRTQLVTLTRYLNFREVIYLFCISDFSHVNMGIISI